MPFFISYIDENPSPLGISAASTAVPGAGFHSGLSYQFNRAYTLHDAPYMQPEVKRWPGRRSLLKTRQAGSMKNIRLNNWVMQDDDDTPNDADGSGTATITRTKVKTKKPSLYRVLLLNDDFTPMEFVVEVLARFFQMDLEKATQVMLHVHQNGVGECGVYTYEVAETKVTQVMDYARQNQHPLQCVMEKK